MIPKHSRLTETAVRRVLKTRQAVFSTHMIANLRPNTLGRPRFAILLSGKQARGSVNRNYWRRLYYTTASRLITKSGLDITLVLKKWTTLDHRSLVQRDEIMREWQTLFRRVWQSVGWVERQGK